MWKLELICFIFVIGTVEAAGLTTTDVKNTDCSTSDVFNILTCVFRFQDFKSKLEHLKREDKQSIKEFKKTCDSLTFCFDSIKCGQKEKEHEDMMKHIKTICSSAVFAFHEFGDCLTKLETTNSTCFQEWTPLKKLDDKNVDNEKLKKLKEKMCRNVFGKENCMEKEIIKDCGQEKWEEAKKRFEALKTVECGDR